MGNENDQTQPQPSTKTAKKEGNRENETIIINWSENQDLQPMTTPKEKNRQLVNRFRRQLSKLIPAFLCADPKRVQLLFKLLTDIVQISNIKNVKSVEHIITTESRVVNALNSLCSTRRGITINNSNNTSRYHEQFKEIRLIARGGFGSVYLARHVLDQMEYAIKKIRFKCSSTKAQALAEAKTLAKLDHANVVTYKHAWIEDAPEDDTSSVYSSDTSSIADSDDVSERSSVIEDIQTKSILYIQMSLCTKNLRTWLDERHDFSSIKTINMIGTQILSGLDYIHKSSVIHHDFNPLNIFISSRAEEMLVQIGDFGLACCPSTNTHSTERGTLAYSAPEQLKKICTSKSDIYSLGIVLFELINPMQTVNEVCQELREFKKGFVKPILEENYRKWVRIIQQCISESPDNRPTASMILKELKTDDKLKINLMNRSISNLKKENMNLQNDNKTKAEIIENLIHQNEMLQIRNHVNSLEIASLKEKASKKKKWAKKYIKNGVSALKMVGRGQLSTPSTNNTNDWRYPLFSINMQKSMYIPVSLD